MGKGGRGRMSPGKMQRSPKATCPVSHSLELSAALPQVWRVFDPLRKVPPMPKPLLPSSMINRRALLGSLGGMMVGGAAMARRPSDVACSANAADYWVRDKLYWVGESVVWAGTMSC